MRRVRLRKKKRLLIYILYFVLIACLIFSMVNIIKWYIDNLNNRKIKESIGKFVEVDYNSVDDKSNFIVDFDSLREKNGDTVGYLSVNNTDINYVVVKGKDNSYYLRHNFNKDYNVGGWIFADYRNKLDGTDRNTIIYGHNMTDGSMFGSLSNILSGKWNSNSNNFQIVFITEDDMYTYQVFSIYTVKSEDYYIQTRFDDDLQFEKFLDTIKKRSVRYFDVELKKTDNILTLSTCTNYNDGRIVLHAVRVTNNDD